MERGRLIYIEGRNCTDYEKLFDELLNTDTDGEWLYRAGCDWKHFDYEKAADVLIDIDKTGKWIMLAGDDWPWFNYKKGFEKLLEVDRTGKWISNAAMSRIKIEHEYGLVYGWRWFDFKRAFNRILEVDKDGKQIYNAIMFWPKKYIDVKKAFRRILDVDKTGHLIWTIGREWLFDFNKAMDRLLETADDNYTYVFLAEKHWRKFDYLKTIRHFVKQRVLDKLLDEIKHWKLHEDQIVDMIIIAFDEINDDEYIAKCLKYILNWRMYNETRTKVVLRLAATNHISDEILDEAKDMVVKHGYIIKNPSRKIIEEVIDEIV